MARRDVVVAFARTPVGGEGGAAVGMLEGMLAVGAIKCFLTMGGV